MEENKRGDYVEEEGSEQKHLQEDMKNLCFMINRGLRSQVPTFLAILVIAWSVLYGTTRQRGSGS